MGDFNARHHCICSSRGNIIYPFVENEELVVLNTGEATHFHVQTGSFSVIDLSLCSPDCFLDFTWEIMDDLLGSDHFPILLNIVDEIVTPRSPRWNIDKANWALFASLTQLEVNVDDFLTIDDALDFLYENVINAGLKAIPQSSGKFRRKPVPWWNLQCSITHKAMRVAFTHYRRNKCPYFLISFKRARARFRYVIKQAKRQSWINFISTVNWKTSMPEVWNKIRKISG